MKFSDLVFKPHRDGKPGHFQALVKFTHGRSMSVTRWTTPNEYHFSDADHPYEVLMPDGELMEYQTASDIDDLLAAVNA